MNDCDHDRRVNVHAEYDRGPGLAVEVCVDCHAHGHEGRWYGFANVARIDAEGFRYTVLSRSFWPHRRARGFLLRLAAVEAESGRTREAGRLADAALMLPGGGSEDATRGALAALGWDKGRVEDAVRRLARGGA